MKLYIDLKSGKMMSPATAAFIARGKRIYHGVSLSVKTRENGFSFAAKLAFPVIHDDQFGVDRLNMWGRDLFIWIAELEKDDLDRFLRLRLQFI